MRSTTVSRSCAFSALSRSSGLGSLSLETCLFGPPLGRRACWRANCRLSTFFILFDRELSFMNYPLYPHHRLSKSTRSARDRHGLFRAVARVAARSRSPSIQKCSELKPPNISGRPTSNLSDSSHRDCPFFPPSWISSEVCSVGHTRHANAGFRFQGQSWGNRPVFLWIEDLGCCASG